jgi:hypothetical protein
LFNVSITLLASEDLFSKGKQILTESEVKQDSKNEEEIARIPTKQCP